ncbi:MAG: formylmethanofuran dehydrogenase subunit C [Betaproteobacteria bacterium]
MTPLTLALREPRGSDIDVSVLAPDRLAGLDAAAIGALRLSGGQRVADLFDIEGGDVQHIVIRNAAERLTHIGAGMRSGKITVEGDCGAYAGQALRGGRLIITGNAGAFTGAANAGARQGMRGGLIAIYGNTGDRLGERMRRGLILIGGSAGAYCAANMLAGTIFVAGTVGTMPGFGLKRGTLLLRLAPAEIPVTFQDSGEHALLFLTLLEKHLRHEGPELARFLPLHQGSNPAQSSQTIRRYCGDLACGATGEMLVFV